MTTTLHYNPMEGGYKTDPTRTNLGRELITFETIDANLLADQREYAMYWARYNEIMRAIQAGEVNPDKEVLFELGQLSDLLGIAPLDFSEPDTAISDLRAELRDEEVNQDELTALIYELTARGMFDKLWTTREDTDGCVL